jgi:VWFA-related protein
MIRIALLPVFLLLVCSSSQTATIVMDVSVVDRKGQPVMGLTAADFEVLEDRRPMRVTAVQGVSVSGDGGSLADGRITVLFLDDATPSPTGEENQAKEIAAHFVDRLEANDLAGVIFAATPSGAGNLTADRVTLKTAIGRYKQRIGQFTMPNPESTRLSRGSYDRFDTGATALYRTTLQSLKRVIERLAVVENRRKAVVMISAGIPFVPPDPRRIATDDPTGTSESVIEDLRAVIRAAQQSKVTIYTIDPGGLRLSGQHFDDTTLTSDAPSTVSAVGQANQSFLRSLSMNTGGFATMNTNDTSLPAANILKDLSGYYMVTFESDQAGDRFRPVTIKVKRSGVTVRSRPGYWPSR